MSTKKTGETGEELAVDFLLHKGYEILFKNWRYKRLEIDIIAKIDNIIVFIEVKTRNSKTFGTPETFVDDAKMEKMSQAADAFIIQNNLDTELRFDIISIYKTEIEHFKDAFYFYN